MSKTLAVPLLAAVLLLGAGASAQETKLTLGVYLPGSVENRDQQFEYGAALAASLGAQLGATVSAKPFARFEDFSKAASSGTLDLGVVDAVVLAGARSEYDAIAVAQYESDSQGRWGVVAAQQSSVGRLKGKRLSLVKGAGSEAEFVNNLVFAGDLPGGHFKLVFVPTVDSALTAIEAGKADAALVPLAYAPKNLKVLYRTVRVPAAVIVNFKANEAALKAAVGKMQSPAPLGRFVVGSGDEVSQLKRRIARPPPARAPYVSLSPTYRPDPRTLTPFSSTGLSFPTFLEFVEVSKDHPDD